MTKMDMMDLYNMEEASAALDEAVQTKVELMNEIEKLNSIILWSKVLNVVLR